MALDVDPRIRPIDEHAVGAAAELEELSGDKLPSDFRAHLWNMLNSYRRYSAMKADGVPLSLRLRRCGLDRFDGSVDQYSAVRDGARRSWFSGTVRCRCKACPVCLVTRRMADREEIRRTCELVHKADESRSLHAPALLVTLTVKHGFSDSLDLTYAGVRECWRAFIQGREWQRVKRSFGLDRFIVREEVTHGRYGWHPHMHVLFLPSRSITAERLQELRAWTFERWRAIVVRKLGIAYEPVRHALGDDGLLHDVGADLREVSAVEYLAKLGFELAGDAYKRAGRGVTPLGLLDAWCRESDYNALSRYQSFERATKGRCDLTWSRSLRPFRDLARADIDEQAKRERNESRLDASYPGRIWDMLAEYELQRLPSLLAAGEIERLEVMLRGVLSGDDFDAVVEATWALREREGAPVVDMLQRRIDDTVERERQLRLGFRGSG